jgi:hypothetical protein
LPNKCSILKKVFFIFLKCCKVIVALKIGIENIQMHFCLGKSIFPAGSVADPDLDSLVPCTDPAPDTDPLIIKQK